MCNADLGYRPCVGIMLLNAENKVWIGRRMDANRLKADAGGVWWQMPQGGIDEGEDPRTAAFRELHEETDVREHHVRVLAQTSQWLRYDLPASLVGKMWKGRYRGQEQMWFAMRFLGEDGDINIGPRPGIKAEFDAWRWADVDELLDIVIPFKRDIYVSVIAEFGHLAGAGAGS